MLCPYPNGSRGKTMTAGQTTDFIAAFFPAGLFIRFIYIHTAA